MLLFVLLLNITFISHIYDWTTPGYSLKPVKTNETLKITSDRGSITFSKNTTFSVYYVGGENASDGNPGTKDAPFATISNAASILK